MAQIACSLVPLSKLSVSGMTLVQPQTMRSRNYMMVPLHLILMLLPTLVQPQSFGVVSIGSHHPLVDYGPLHFWLHLRSDGALGQWPVRAIQPFRSLC